MSLNGALHVGRSALFSSQTALQVAGNNMANAATPGYRRRTLHLGALRGVTLPSGAYVGQGVQVMGIRREIDSSLLARFRSSVADQQANLIDQRFLTSIETLQNELSGNDISSLLSTFFNGFSELANNPDDGAMRSIVVQHGQTLASEVSRLRVEYGNVQQEIDQALANSELTVNDLLDQIAMLNGEIATLEPVSGEAGALRDQRGVLLDELSQYMDITVIEQDGGMVDVLVSSTPVLLGTDSRGIEVRHTSKDSGTEVSLRVGADGSEIAVNSGSIGGLLRQREETVEPLIDALDNFASELIFQVNRLHSQGQGTTGYSSVAGTYHVDDTTANLNSTMSGLPYRIENGSFFLHVTNSETGVRTTHEIQVDGDAMSLDDLINEINVVVGVPNVTASVSSSGGLQLDATSGYEMSFSDDQSGALAALGINTFFTGSSASDIGVNEYIVSDPSLLAAGEGHVAGSNGTAKLIANLQDERLEALGGSSMREFWQQEVGKLAVKTGAANAAVQSTTIVRDSLSAQIEAVSGVSLDEESINLLTFQRQYQAAARFISVIDETMQTLLSIG